MGLVVSWRADSQSLSMAQSRNYPMCKNSARYNRTRNFGLCGDVEGKKTEKFVFRSALRPNQISFSHNQDPCRKWSVQRSRGNNDDQYAAGDGSLNRCRAGAQPNRPISGHRYTRGSAAWRCPNSVVFCPNFLLAAFIRVARFSFLPCRWSRAGPGTHSKTG